MQIDDCRQNETGSPTHMVGFGATTDMLHANRFQPGITVTHVCVALNAVVTQGEIQFHTVGTGGMPGGTFYTQPFSLAPNSSGFQLVQLTTPQAPATEFWLTIEYPNAPGGQTHQHTGPRVAGQAAVHPVGFGGWEDYDNVGATGYVNNAPVIRALQLSQTGGPTPCVTCPAGANQVCGSCGATPGICDGCSGAHFEIADCSEIYCGELQADGINQEEHWYEVSVPPTANGLAEILLTFEADMDLSVEVHDGLCSQPIPGILNGMFVPECTQQSLTTIVNAPGTYHIQVAPAGSVTNHQCGTANTYVMEVDFWDSATGVHCPGSTVSCPAATNDCFVVSGGPGCNDSACCDAVCACDPFCCNVSWDALCVGFPPSTGCSAIDLPQCIGCGDPGNDCCVAGTGPHCNDAECCVEVCAVDPFCCETTWDGLCATEAQANCAVCAGGPSNQICSAADPIPFKIPVAFDSTNAATDGPAEPAPCNFSGTQDSDVWFEFTAECDKTYVFELQASAGSAPDRMMAIYPGGCPTQPGTVAACDESASGTLALAMNLVAGDHVLIRVGTPGGFPAQSVLKVTGPTCPFDLNDDCVVNVFDVLICLGNWGPGQNQCNVTGLLGMLGAWGPCP